MNYRLIQPSECRPRIAELIGFLTSKAEVGGSNSGENNVRYIFFSFANEDILTASKGDVEIDVKNRNSSIVFFLYMKS